MKKFLLGILIVLFCSFNVYASSVMFVEWDTVKNVSFVYNGNYKTTGATQFDVSLDYDWDQLMDFFTIGYCIDLDGLIYNEGYYVVDEKDNIGYEHASWLMDVYADDAINDNYKQAGLQLAIWESVYKDNFNYTPTGTIGTHYQTYYTDIYSTNLNYEYTVLDHFETKYQNLLVRNTPIPEPATLFLVGFGLLTISGITRKNIYLK